MKDKLQELGADITFNAIAGGRALLLGTDIQESAGRSVAAKPEANKQRHLFEKKK